ncbi:MAG: hypothetical protein JXR84_06450 [Anaerolineae bacterium]|nr:hypothetical protein [Anaerolineae bacterium]
MSRLPLKDLIISKKRPQTTLSLVPAFQQQTGEMVENYIFTGTIRAHFEAILEEVARGQGQGFWVQAEYGAGKTHFLVTLAALLSNLNDDLWSQVADETIRQYQRRLGSFRLFPVVVSLRGEGTGNNLVDRSLLDVLLEEGFQRALDHAGIKEQVQVTAAEDLWAWLQSKAGQGIRQDAEAYVQRQTGVLLQDYRDDENIEAAGRLIAEYCQSAGIRPDIVSSVKARLGHIYKQITDPGVGKYDGLLVVIDEYEGWEKNHNSDDELSADAELLETLGYLLPRDLGYHVFTIVASQSSVPAKLRGEQAGDRFINIPLLAQGNERDYDVIVSRRVRQLNQDRLPEINDHYEYYTHNFAFARDLTLEEFYDIFPFQPRCFDVARHITARDLPTARSGLFVFWEVLNARNLLDRTMLIRVPDLLTSRHLVEDCLTTTVYKEAYQAYRAAYEALAAFGLEPQDLSLAQDSLTALFLHYLAFMDAPQAMKLDEIAEATLTTDDFMRASDNVAYVLSQIQALPQVEFDSASAQFIPAGGDGPSVVTLFNEEKRRFLRDRYKLQQAWTNSLFFTPSDTGGAAGLFTEFPPDERVTRRVETRNLEYAGEVTVSTGWRLDQGLALSKEDTHFRLIILTPSTAHSVKSSIIEDPRIAVILPGEMTDEARDAAAAYLAWQSMQESYEKKTGRDAEEVRSWLGTQRRSFMDTLTDTHLKLYQAGQVITRDDLAISARDAFGRGGGNDARIAYLVEQLLTAAYAQLPVASNQFRHTLTPSEIGKVFAGYFDKQPRPADTAAVRNYGVALGLSHPDRPEHFLSQSPRVFELIEEMLQARQGADLPIWQMYDRLAMPPCGLPYTLIQLYLLAFVRCGVPRVDLLLKAGHTLRDSSRRPINRERLTAGTVTDLEWKPGLDRYFDALVPAAGPTWNETLAYAREIADDLRSTTDQAQIEAQSERLSGALHDLENDLVTQKRNLQVLAGTLGADAPAETSQALERLTRLTDNLAANYADFYERAEHVFEAGPETLRGDMQVFTRLRALSSVAAEIGALKRYLDDVSLPPSEHQLSTDRMMLNAQFSLNELVRDPETWTRLREEFRQFQRRYQTAYQKHHRDHYQALVALSESLVDVPRRVQALALMNRIEGLGAPLGSDLQSRYETLQAQLAPCPITQVMAVSVEHGPTCERCPQRLRLTDEPPSQAVESLLRDLDAALDSKRRQLASEAIHRVLTRTDRADMATFLDAVRAADLAALVDVMSPDLAAFVERMLVEESLLTAETDVLVRLAGQFPSLEESDVERMVTALRGLLQAAFAQARQENPDKKTIRLNLRS